MTNRKWTNEASKENGKKGGEALRQKRMAEYNSAKKACKYCRTVFPWGQHKKTFCSTICSGKHTAANRDYSKSPSGPKPKPKEPKALYSTLYKCVCKHCGVEWRGRRPIRVCEIHEPLYSHDGRAKYWFTFGLSKYPDLFDGEIIRKYGMRSSENPNGVTRDHRVSVQTAILNNYDPYYIKHPLNCELMLFEKNNIKKTGSSISYSELVEQVKKYDLVSGMGPRSSSYEDVALTKHELPARIR